MKVSPTPTSPKQRSQRSKENGLDAYYHAIERPLPGRRHSIAVILIAVVAGLIGGVVGQVAMEGFFPGVRIERIQVVDRESHPPSTSDFAVVVRTALEQVQPAVIRLYPADTEETGLTHDTLLGNGIALTSDGLIVTTTEVIDDPARAYLAMTSEQRVFEVQSAIVDEVSGAVFFRIEAQGLRVADFSELDTMASGDQLALVDVPGTTGSRVIPLTLLNPLRTFSAGVLESSERIDRFVDVTPTPEDATRGAPVVTVDGKLVGLWKTDANGKPQTVPALAFQSAVEYILQYGSLQHPVFGVQYLDLAWALDEDQPFSTRSDRGALLRGTTDRPAIAEGSVAADAGMVEGDLITRVGDVDVNHVRSFSFLLQSYQPDDTIQITIRRGDEDLTVTVPLVSSETDDSESAGTE